MDPCGAELTGSRTGDDGDCGGIVTTSWKWPMVSWEVRPGVLTTVATTRTRMAWCSPFSIVTGTSPEAPPIGTWAELMILTLFSADVT